MRNKKQRPPVEVAVEGLDGDGVATGVDAIGRRWSLRGAQPGSRVLAVGRASHGGVFAEVEAASDAVSARCPQFGACGGCLYQRTPLDRQRAEKLLALRSLLAPLGAPDAGIRSASTDGYGYRNRLELSFGTQRFVPREEMNAAGEGALDRDGRFLGMHGAGHYARIVDTPDCALATPAMNRVLAAVRADTLASPWPIFDQREKAGLWRHLGLREGRDGVIAMVYTATGGEAEAAWLRERAPRWGAVSVLWYSTDLHSDAAVGELREVLHGEASLRVSLGGVPLALSPLAFFQVNPEGAEVLLDEIRRALGSGGLLLDLYCGVGSLGLALHSAFDRVAGLDVVEEGIAAANANATALGVRADYRAGLAEKTLPALLADHGIHPDKRSETRLAVLVDPPRNGLHPEALAALAPLPADVLVYVACRPSSLVRDGLRLAAAGWRCTGWTAVDLFPQTAHVEVVARFVR